MSILDDDTAEVDTVLRTTHGLAVLEDVHTREDTVVSLDDLVASLDVETDAFDDRRRLAVRLHHVTLPTLDEAGVIDYDATDRLVESGDGELVDQVLDLLREN